MNGFQGPCFPLMLTEQQQVHCQGLQQKYMSLSFTEYESNYFPTHRNIIIE